MRMISLLACSVALVGWSSMASADPDKDESGKGRWRGGYERSYGVPGAGYDRHDRYERREARERRQQRAFKQEYDDGNCKYERKLEKSGEYKEEVKCRAGRRSAYRY